VNFNKHFNLEGRHAFLSPSQYHWIRYTDEHLAERWVTKMAAQRGSEFHELASRLIKLKVKLPATKKTLNSFVNDVIGFKMESELQLCYSDNCFGTADALGFRKSRGDDFFTLRIFDLKTGESKASVDQLLVYAALFCLEYNFKAFELAYDLRIYQSDDVAKFEVDPKDVAQIMAQIVHFDKLIEEWKQEEA
jgi:hypothetical protein